MLMHEKTCVIPIIDCHDPGRSVSGEPNIDSTSGEPNIDSGSLNNAKQFSIDVFFQNVPHYLQKKVGKINS